MGSMLPPATTSQDHLALQQPARLGRRRRSTTLSEVNDGLWPTDGRLDHDPDQAARRHIGQDGPTRNPAESAHRRLGQISTGAVAFVDYGFGMMGWCGSHLDGVGLRRLGRRSRVSGFRWPTQPGHAGTRPVTGWFVDEAYVNVGGVWVSSTGPWTSTARSSTCSSQPAVMAMRPAGSSAER